MSCRLYAVAKDHKNAAGELPSFLAKILRVKAFLILPKIARNPQLKQLVCSVMRRSKKKGPRLESDGTAYLWPQFRSDGR